MCMATITMTLEHYNAIVDELLNGLKSSEQKKYTKTLNVHIVKLLIIGIIHIHHYIIIDYIV